MFSVQQMTHPQSGTALVTRKNPEFCLGDQTRFTEKPLHQVVQVSAGSLRRSKSVFEIPAQLCIEDTQEGQPTSSQDSTVSFGAHVRRHTGDLVESPMFDKDLRAVMEPYLRKARLRREQARDQALLEVDGTIASSIGVPYASLRTETPFLFDVHSFPMHQMLAQTLRVDDLSKLHQHSIQDKRQLLQPLLQPEFRREFHACYDQFVTAFCIPLLHSLAMKSRVFFTTSPTASSKITYRYQAFPCVRIVRPGEASIEPHCDFADGHSIGCLNFHIPLTAAYGTNALYTESHAGKEDFHPLTAKAVGLGYIFDGARCLHFGLENTTQVTRVSLDFRIAIYREDRCNDSELCTREMLEDKYSAPGYYDEAVIETGRGQMPSHFVAKKKNPSILLEPDERVGFPFA